MPTLLPIAQDFGSTEINSSASISFNSCPYSNRAQSFFETGYGLGNGLACLLTAPEKMNSRNDFNSNASERYNFGKESNAFETKERCSLLPGLWFQDFCDEGGGTDL